MNKCDLCGVETEMLNIAGEHLVCAWCKEKLKNNIGQKCLACGAYGFIPMTEKNINRVMFFIPLTFAEVMNADLVVVWDGCPACIEKSGLDVAMGE